MRPIVRASIAREISDKIASKTRSYMVGLTALETAAENRHFRLGFGLRILKHSDATRAVAGQAVREQALDDGMEIRCAATSCGVRARTEVTVTHRRALASRGAGHRSVEAGFA